MVDKHPDMPVQHVCRWRTSAETLDLIEAFERIEALLIRLDDRLRLLEAPRDELASTKRSTP